MNEYAGNWLSTLYTPQFHFLNPIEEEVDIRDIAHSLSLVCRFGGHCNRFYSVAEHSYYVSLLLGAEGADAVTVMAGLLHDAEETYIPDIPSPVKIHMPEARAMYETLSAVIYKKFDIEGADWERVKDIDHRICITEAKQLGLWSEEWREVPGEPINFPIGCWDPEKAETKFIRRYQAFQQLRDLTEHKDG